ncbi:MAG: hypothetical protein U0573_01130 [Phycisphaerales bacterium]|nr:hypothetical protein [Planctomycetota bacterium]
MSWKRCTPGRWPEPAHLRRLCFVLLLCTASASAIAQRLKLKGDMPEPGSGAATIELARTLRQEADVLTAAVPKTPRDAARAAYLHCAGTLLESGEARGPAGTHQVIAGLALSLDRAAALSAITSGLLNDAELELASSDLTSIAQNPSISAAELDRALRNALSLLLQKACPAPGADLWPWPERPGLSMPAWPAPKLSPEASAALEALHARALIADSWIAYRPGARALARLIAAAAPDGSRLGEPARSKWIAEYAASLGALNADRAGVEALARLERLATLARILTLFEPFESAPGGKELKKSLLTFIETLSDPTPQESERLSRIEQWLTSIAAITTLADEKDVVRQLRPAIRSVAEMCRTTQQEAIESLSGAFASAAAASEPAVLAAVNLHKANLSLLRTVRRASAVLEDPAKVGPEPAVTESARPIADMLLKLAKEVADPRQRNRALEPLRILASDIADLWELPGEKQLRANDQAFFAQFGGKAADVLGLIDRERAAWRKDLGGKVSASAEAHAQKLGAVRLLLLLARDAADCKAAGRLLPQWGGWWIEPTTLETLVGRADAALPALFSEIEAAQSPAALAAARSAQRQNAIVALAARVARAIPADAPAAITLRSVRSVACGTPDDRAVLLAPWRDRIALVCRYSRENDEQSARFAAQKAYECADAMDRLEE